MSAERITNADLAVRLESIQRLAVEAGIATAERAARFQIQHGSKLYGNTFRLYQFGADTVQERPGSNFPYGTGHYSPAGLPEFLGWTKREAFEALGLIRDTLAAIAHAKWEAEQAR